MDRRTEESLQQSIAQVEEERRRELVEAARASLNNVFALLDQQIAANAPEVDTSIGATPGHWRENMRVWSLNDAKLQVVRLNTVIQQSDMEMPFKVVVHTSITLSVPPDALGYTGRSHSLWYCDAQDRGVFRWYETAFMQLSSQSDRQIVPFAMSPGERDVVIALSSVMHIYQVAWPFMPIDQGDEDGFIERWISWFAEGAQGQLAYPSRLPERDPQGSWRRT